MLKKPIIARAVALALMLSGSAATADTIELRADHWCPFNCEPGGDHPGFMVEIAREALALYGHDVNYETMNWARSIEYVNSGRIDGVIGTDEFESPHLVFGPPLGAYQEVVAFRPGETVQVDGVEAIDGLRLGAIQGYDYGEAINDYIASRGGDSGMVQLLSSDNALEQNLRKLLAGRIDLVPEERSVLAYTLTQMGLASRVETVQHEEATNLFIAFSPALDTSATYATQLSEGVERLRASGRVAEILAKYGLTE